MEPVLSALAPSTPKWRFLEHLGLAHSEAQHVYTSMKADAVIAWQRLQADPDASLPLCQDRNTDRPPFAINQMNETAIRREILRGAYGTSFETAISEAVVGMDIPTAVFAFVVRQPRLLMAAVVST
ncbi:hypothetical protein AMS68_002028 [Peltaster fructicola]|uniref:Uncharacterized protein n=1 Tax=Peltaster fructicola TaxID=286661 RepID=A0A6H0XPD4_9PEZI|nr:hypothetical protein AMS68_002028 [Peltaster fructicola]